MRYCWFFWGDFLDYIYLHELRNYGIPQKLNYNHYHDLYLEVDNEERLRSKLYDKQYGVKFPFPFDFRMQYQGRN
jgi:hypothetical protein